jgi:enoyl-CoA hydratase
MIDSDTDLIQYEVDGHVARIWLNRPEKKNAFTLAMIKRMRASFMAAQQNPDVRAIILRGRGGTLCAGVDLAEVMESGEVSRDDHEPYLDLCNTVAKSTKPTIAVVEGYLTGGGHSLVINCDFAIASTEAKLGDYYMRRGLIGAGNAYYWLPRIVGLRRAKQLVLTGMLLSGVEAAQWGLVTSAVAPEELDDAVEALLAQLVDKSPLAMEIAKRALDRSMDLDWASFQVMQEFSSDYIISPSYDAREGISAFLEKRDPQFKGR